jgi:hypothetical protein
MASDEGFRPKNLIIFFCVLLLAGAGGAGAYLAEVLYLRPMREQRVLVENLKSIVAQFTRDYRKAEIEVVSQSEQPLRTAFKFTEVNEQGDALSEPRAFTVEGDVAYFDALVIKFEEPFKPLDELPLKQEHLAEPLLHKALIVFRRVFGEKQKPEDGFPLDQPGAAPGVYATKDQSALERKLWSQFWQLANDLKLAREHGVRAAHGQAVYTKLVLGKRYIIEQRVTGEMTIKPVR